MTPESFRDSAGPTSATGNPALARASEIINKTQSISPDESLRLELDGIVALGERNRRKTSFAIFSSPRNTRREHHERRPKRSCTLL